MIRTLVPFMLCVALGGCGIAPTAPSARPEYSGPTGFPVDPMLPHGDALMTLMRELFPHSKYISINGGWPGSDADYDYLTCGVSWGIDHGFESVYHRYVIFAKKKKSEDWSQARVFDQENIPFGEFNGPMKVLEKKGREFKRPKPNKAPEPTTMAVTPRAIASSDSHTFPASARGAPAMVVAHL
jgi:hypothetical protein